MKISENHTTSAIITIGFFGVFALMFLQPRISGQKKSLENIYTNYEVSDLPEEVFQDSLHWKNNFWFFYLSNRLLSVKAIKAW